MLSEEDLRVLARLVHLGRFGSKVRQPIVQSSHRPRIDSILRVDEPSTNTASRDALRECDGPEDRGSGRTLTRQRRIAQHARKRQVEHLSALTQLAGVFPPVFARFFNFFPPLLQLGLYHS